MDNSIPLELGYTQPRKKEGHCDTTVHTVHPYALYVLHCLTLMYCTYYILYVLCTFQVSHVEASSSTSVQTLPLAHSVALHLTKLSHTRLAVSAC